MKKKKKRKPAPRLPRRMHNEERAIECANALKRAGLERGGCAAKATTVKLHAEA